MEKKKSNIIKQGEHICSIYRNKKEQFLSIVKFFSEGLYSNNKCIYIADENTREDIIFNLSKMGLDIKGHIKSKQFAILSPEDTYLENGTFEPDRMIKLLKKTENDAIKEGYSGLRVTGEMTAVLKHIKDSQKLIEYETKLNYFFPRSKTSAICQYNETKIKHDILLEAIHTHPIVIIYGKKYENSYYAPPDTIKTHKDMLPKDSYELIKEDIMDRD